MKSVDSRLGALPSQMLLELIDTGNIVGTESARVRPSSIDLTLSDEVYRVEGIFQPRPGEPIREVLKQVKHDRYSWGQPLVCGQMYLARLNEKLSLPADVYGYCNPKSTSGRLDLHVRLLADGVPRYDSLTPAGWGGEMWVSIVPKTFSLILHAGLSLNQIRLFNADTRLDENKIQEAVSKYQLLWRLDDQVPLSYEELKIRDNDGSLILTLDLKHQPLGYRAKLDVETALDLKQLAHYEAQDFFEPIKLDGPLLTLRRGEFYILSTREAVRVPPELACEMVPMDEKSGEFRSHYAGFIDPGWGWGKTGEGKGRPLTLEVRPFEDIIVRHGQPIAKIKFEVMAELPALVYDSLDSNYVKQIGPRLAKHFK